MFRKQASAGAIAMSLSLLPRSVSPSPSENSRRRVRAGFLLAGLGLLVLSGCAMRSDYEAYYLAEQGDFEGSLKAAEKARGQGIDGILFGSGASGCRDYASVVTVLVAKGDFAGARQACSRYERECAVVPDNALCFVYENSALEAARSDADLADAMSADAREQLHFRWLMIRDDYEKRGIKRPIY
ncbi:MAG: hypothetical protein V2I82_02060 [Halieaceae bacterium]|jgi:hypothetical protein|nr:hypothetical protein [Halieaceae bacterium]